MENTTRIEIRTGSDSDIPKISAAYDFLNSIGVPFSPRILSAHRTPQSMIDEARSLADSGFRVSVAGAGGSAHLPGMTASETLLPVVGLPVFTSNLAGIDSLYSIIQMPNGIPVGSVGPGQAEGAAILAAQIAYVDDAEVRNKIRKKRGLEGTLAADFNPKPSVGIILSKGVETDVNKYREMKELIAKLGLESAETEVSFGEKSIKEKFEELEFAEVSSIIAICGAKSNDFPRSPADITDIPVIGLPISKGFAGIESLQKRDIFRNMLNFNDDSSKACPVAGMGINRYLNAALFAAQIIGSFTPKIQNNVRSYREDLAKTVKEKDDRLKREGLEAFLK